MSSLEQQNYRDVEKLIQNIASKTELGFQMFSFLIEHDLLRDITINTTTWVSRSNNGTKTIHLGTGPQSATLHNRLSYQDLSQEDTMIQRFNHEMGHLFLRGTLNSPETQNLLDLTAGARHASGYRRGLSAIGSIDFYQDRQRPEEDAADLVAMRLRSRDYLGSFATFLANPLQRAVHEEIGLVTLDAGADVLVEQVDKTILPVRMVTT